MKFSLAGVFLLGAGFAMAGNWIEGCGDCRIRSQGTFLTCEDCTNKFLTKPTESTMDFTTCYANDFGQLSSRYGGFFQYSCSDIQIRADGILHASCENGAGANVEAAIFIADNIANKFPWGIGCKDASDDDLLLPSPPPFVD